MLQATWKSQYESICNAPVTLVEAKDIETGHPAIQFIDEFHALRAENDGTPHRRQLLPSRFRNFLRWFFIFEREEQAESPRFIVRLEGTSVVELTHHDYTGRFLDEFTNSQCYGGRHRVLDQVSTLHEPRFARIMVKDATLAEYRTDVSVGFFPFIAGRDNDRQQIVAVVAPQNQDLRALL